MTGSDGLFTYPAICKFVAAETEVDAEAIITSKHFFGTLKRQEN